MWTRATAADGLTDVADDETNHDDEDLLDVEGEPHTDFRPELDKRCVQKSPPVSMNRTELFISP